MNGTRIEETGGKGVLIPAAEDMQLERKETCTCQNVGAATLRTAWVQRIGEHGQVGVLEI